LTLLVSKTRSRGFESSLPRLSSKEKLLLERKQAFRQCPTVSLGTP
jgi:hypothetical protein